MKNLSAALLLIGASITSSLVSAQEVVLTTKMQNYDGDGAYLAIYLTDENGKYQNTLWVAGKKSKYYKHLAGWARGSRLRSSEYDGITGASMTSGMTFNVTVDIADQYIDSGYQIHIDSAVEDMRDKRNDIVVPLTKQGADIPTNGSGYVKTFTYSL